MRYLDHNAGTPLHPEVADFLARAYRSEVAGNPSSVHGAGRAARARLDDARERVARVLGRSPREVLFVSSGSEACAMAVLGVGLGLRRGVAVTAGGLLLAAGFLVTTVGDPVALGPTAGFAVAVFAVLELAFASLDAAVPTRWDARSRRLRGSEAIVGLTAAGAGVVTVGAVAASGRDAGLGLFAAGVAAAVVVLVAIERRARSRPRRSPTPR